MSKGAIELPSQTYLREAFDYDPQSGILRWGARPREHFGTVGRWKYHNARFSGRVAGAEWSGRCNSKYRHVSLKVGERQRYFATHRIIWMWMMGSIPADHEVDHIDLDGLNNKWSNLRLATSSENLCNAPLRRDNTTGFKGVSKYRNRFQAYINANGKRISLGVFPTAQTAYNARVQAAAEHYGQFGRER